MDKNRRNFLKGAASVLAGSPWITQAMVEHAREAGEMVAGQNHAAVAKNESYWDKIRKAYSISDDFINLENGYYTLMSKPVMEAQIDHLRYINHNPSYYMREHQNDDKERIKNALAEFSGASPEELVICRNTTEALNTIIFGLNAKPGDEAIITDQDYGSMRAQFEMRAKRYGTVNKVISLPLHPKNDREIVDTFEKAITPRTKIILVTHLINISGQVLPVRKIAEMAHSKGIEIISDSAHSFAHIDFKIPDLDCDYFGTSLHKWLGAPLGLGLMYIKKEKIEKVWPLYGDTSYEEHDIRKFEHFGTHPCHADLSILDALEFHNSIGSERKQNRLRYLKKYWTEQVKDVPGIIINTPWEEERHGGIGNVAIKGMEPGELSDKLFKEFNIYTAPIGNPAVGGVRITPMLYNTTDELDQLVTALKKIAGS